MRVRVTSSDTAACGMYRTIWPTEQLRRRHFDVRCRFGVDVLIGDDGYIREIQHNPGVLVIQRPTSRTTLDILRAAKRQGIETVVETDDNFSKLVAGHPARHRKSVEYSPVWMSKACDEADRVVVTTPALAEQYVPDSRARIVPNFLHPGHLRAELPERGELLIGWPGALFTHPGDLDVCGAAVAKAVVELDCRFVAFGTAADGQAVHDLLGIPEKHRLVWPWAPLGDWGPDGYAAKLRGLDIVLCPLAPNVFNEAKSSLKPLEASGSGAWPIMSPSGPYRQFHDDVFLGDVCSTPNEWFEAIMERGQKLPPRNMIRNQVKHLSLANHAVDFWKAWTE